LKVAFVSVFYPFRGGIAQSNAHLYRAFESLGHEVKVWNFTTQYPAFLFPGTSQFVSKDDVADEIPSNRTLSSINPFSYARTFKKVSKFAPDLVIFRFWMPFFAPSLGYISGKLKKKGCKVIALVDNLIPHEQRFGDKHLTKYFLKRVSGFVVMSDVVERDLNNALPKANYLHYPHPIYSHFGDKMNRAEALEKLGIKGNKKVILYFGLIRKYKGLDILIEAFDQLDAMYELLIVGEPYESFDTYKNLIDRNKNRDRIHAITRYVSDEEVPLYFSAADVCVLPYRTATQSGVIAIAYHFDLPVIVTDVGGLRKTVESFGTGSVVDSPNADQFQNAIKDYFKNNKQAPMSSAIQAFKSKYSWNGMAEEIIKLPT